MAIMAQATSHAPATARPPRVCTLVPFIIIVPRFGASSIKLNIVLSLPHVHNENGEGLKPTEATQLLWMCQSIASFKIFS